MSSVILVYLHGFNSSPASYKARVLSNHLHSIDLLEQVLIPEIPPQPDKAIKMLESLIEDLQSRHEVALAGSSLGGFYATVLAERFTLRATLVNPAVRPDLLLTRYLGKNVNYNSSEHWILDEKHIKQLHDMDVEPVTQLERYMVLLQTGDDTLDYREAERKYSGALMYIEQGGDHSFVNFEASIPRILEFSHLQG